MTSGGGYDGSGQPDFSKFSWTPSVSCTTEKINAKVALITADECILAGGAWSFGETNNYLKRSYDYWTMSPVGFYQGVESYTVSFNGIYDFAVINISGVLPVITLKADTTISSGNGTSTNPYVIG